jgi:hypothetical protein
VTNLATVIDTTGTFTATVTADSADDKVTVTIDVGTKGLTAEGAPLQQISIQPMTAPPEPPEDTSAIGLVYDFGPDGATFDEPVTITLTYDPADLPEGASEGTLYLAWWDAAASSWVRLVSTVDPVTHTITATIEHFTAFGIIVPSSPAAFSTSSLTIAPAQVEVGKPVTITAIITNTGDLSGSHDVSFKLDNAVVETRTVTLAGGASQTVTFTTTSSKAGTYVIAVDGMLGSLVVKEAPVPPVIPPKPAAFTIRQLTVSPTAVKVGEEVTVVATVANTGEVEGTYTATLKINQAVEATKTVTVTGGKSTDVAFSVAKGVAGSYQVEVGGQTGTFTVTTPPMDWWVWLIVGLAVAVAAAVTFVLLRRRAAY